MIAQKWKVRAGILAAASVIFFAGNSIITKADGSSSTVGTVDDPLITKSYFDQQIANAVKQEVAAQLSNSTPGTTLPTPDSGGTGITVVQLQAGQTLQAGAGSELIVRTGKVLAFSSDENGIPDVTSGKDISAGSAIELNHLLIFPREGRGIKPDPKSKATVFVMVRGEYSIVNADGTQATP